MPLLKSVPSLQQLCIRCVSSNIDFWCTGNENRNRRRLKLTTEDNQVSRLPNAILNDICAWVMREVKFRPHHLKSIINEYTRDLDFSHIAVLGDRDGELYYHGVRLISNICTDCTNLTSLNLNNYKGPVNDLAKLTKSLHLIEYLNLEYTGINDSVLRILGNTSPNLRELNITQCVMITDDGISSLCVQNCGPKKYWPGGKCRLIEKLYISRTKCTERGIREMLLNLPFLREIDYHDTLRILEDIYAEDRSRQFRLQTINFYMSDKNITDETLVAASSLCPNVVKLNLVMHVNSNVPWLPGIAEFRQLQELSITCDRFTSFILHYRQIGSTLKLFGSNLKSLTLWKFAEVNLWDIGVNCPLLTTLNLSYVSFDSTVIPSATNNSKLIFGELRELFITCSAVAYPDIPINHLQTMLTNCVHLQSFRFALCDSLTDELLLRVFRCNLFLELRTFRTDFCRNIRLSSVLSLITNSKCLKRVICRPIDEIVQLKALIREENFDIILTDCDCYCSGRACHRCKI